MTSAFTAPPGISLSAATTRACARATSLKMANATGQVQMVSSSILENANATGQVQMVQVQMVSSSPRWPGDKEARDGVVLRPKIDASKVDKMWVNGRYVVSTKILAMDGKPGAKWPANIFQGWTSSPGPASSSDQAVITGDMAEAKQSATIIAMCLLLAQPILSAGYYEVKTDVEMCGALQTCNSNYVSKVKSIGEFKETTGDTFERYAKNYMSLTGTATSGSSVPITYSSSLVTRPTIMTPSLREAKEREASQTANAVASASKPKAAPVAAKPESAKPATTPATKATVAAPQPAAK